MMSSMCTSVQKAPVGLRPAPMGKGVARRSRSVAVKADPSFDRDWLNKNPLVPVLGFVGWTVPSSIPVGALNGNSLFGLLNQYVGKELAHFPTGPALDSPFWLYLITWHVGLFTTMLLGQVGVQGRKQGYW